MCCLCEATFSLPSSAALVPPRSDRTIILAAVFPGESLLVAAEREHVRTKNLGTAEKQVEETQPLVVLIARSSARSTHSEKHVLLGRRQEFDCIGSSQNRFQRSRHIGKFTRE